MTLPELVPILLEPAELAEDLVVHQSSLLGVGNVYSERGKAFQFRPHGIVYLLSCSNLPYVVNVELIGLNRTQTEVLNSDMESVDMAFVELV
jgi:hypothetical protein